MPSAKTRSASRFKLKILDPAPTLDAFKGLATLCNGAKTGQQCKHYWPIVANSANFQGVDTRSVGRERHCTATGGDTDRLGNGGSKMAVYCGRFEASKRPYDPLFEQAVVSSVQSDVVLPPVTDMDLVLAQSHKALMDAAANGETSHYPPAPGVLVTAARTLGGQFAAGQKFWSVEDNIRHYQRTRALPPTGVLDERTQASLDDDKMTAVPDWPPNEFMEPVIRRALSDAKLDGDQWLAMAPIFCKHFFEAASEATAAVESK